MGEPSTAVLDPILDVLACPRCGGGFQWQREDNAPEGDGALRCAACNTSTPVLSGLIFFGETRGTSDAGENPAALRARIGTDEDYRRYADEKIARNVLEPYAAFAPFNESTRAPLPLLYTAGDHLAPNDLVLDLSNRSGWTGAFLAGLFPKQRVIAFWEGDSSVLGYRGFAHWFGLSHKPENLFPIFLPPGLALPLRQGAARLVHGYDILHHRGMPDFLVEALRVASKDGILVFPHMHLSNSEPDPWFARGGTHRHGRDYQALLDRYLAGEDRRAAVLSELSAFDAWVDGSGSPQVFSPDPETSHYNGIVAVAPLPVLAASVSSTRHRALTPDVLFVSNPFLRVNALTRRVHLLEDALSGHLRHMFDRHPAYEAFLLRCVEGLSLVPGELAIIAAMEDGTELARLGGICGLSDSNAEQHVARLVAADLVVPAPIAQRVWRLQQDFHANGHSLIDRDASRVLREWIEAAPQSEVFSLMGVSLTRAEIAEVSAALLRYLARHSAHGNELRLAVADVKIESWLVLVAAAAGWCIRGEKANLGVALRDGDLAFTEGGNAISLMDVMETYGGLATEPASPSERQRPVPILLNGHDILRIARALA